LFPIQNKKLNFKFNYELFNYNNFDKNSWSWTKEGEERGKMTNQTNKTSINI
jgi:hypothetical protein